MSCWASKQKAEEGGQLTHLLLLLLLVLLVVVVVVVVVMVVKVMEAASPWVQKQEDRRP